MKLLGVIGGAEIIVIVLVVLILFGGKKIPELMKGLGTGVKEYKKAVNGIEEEVGNTTKSTNDAPAQQQESRGDAQSASNDAQ